MKSEPPDDETRSRDLELILRCQPAAEPPAWDEFFARFGPLMRIWIRRKRRIGPPEDLEDIYQGLVLKILSGSVLPGFDPDQASFRPYLSTVVSNYIVDEFRKSRRMESLDDELSVPDELSSLADHSAPRSFEQLHAAISHRLAATPHSQRRLLIFNALLDSRSPAEIAVFARVSESTVSRCKTMLREISRAELGLPPPLKKKIVGTAKSRRVPRKPR